MCALLPSPHPHFPHAPFYFPFAYLFFFFFCLFSFVVFSYFLSALSLLFSHVINMAKLLQRLSAGLMANEGQRSPRGDEVEEVKGPEEAIHFPGACIGDAVKIEHAFSRSELVAFIKLIEHETEPSVPQRRDEGEPAQ